MRVLGGRKETKEVSGILRDRSGRCGLSGQTDEGQRGSCNSKVMHLGVGRLGSCRKGKLGWPGVLWYTE